MYRITEALLLLIAICGGKALQCYQCNDCNTLSSSTSLVACGGNDTSTEPEDPNTNSTGNGTSYDFFNGEILEPLADGYICAKITVEGSNTAITNRLCVDTAGLDICNLIPSLNISNIVNATSIDLRACTTDGCNGASNLQTSLAFMATSVLFLYFK